MIISETRRASLSQTPVNCFRSKCRKKEIIVMVLDLDLEDSKSAGWGAGGGGDFTKELSMLNRLRRCVSLHISNIIHMYPHPSTTLRNGITREGKPTLNTRKNATGTNSHILART